MVLDNKTVLTKCIPGPVLAYFQKYRIYDKGIHILLCNDQNLW